MLSSIASRARAVSRVVVAALLALAACTAGSGGGTTAGGGGGGGGGCVDDDAAFCLRMHAECGPASGTDACGQPRTVSSCGACAGMATCGGGGLAGSCGTPTSIGSYAAESAACAALPYGTGTIHYFCDCDGPGAQADCKPGVDSNPGTLALPRKTLAAAMAAAANLGPGETVAFCRGGSFPSGGGTLGAWKPTRCTAAAPCAIREYSPTTFTGRQMPILAHPRIANQRAPRGRYSASTTYAKDDLITGEDGFITHLSLRDGNTGHEPPTQENGYVNTEWWLAWAGPLFGLSKAVNANLQILNLKVQGDGTGEALFVYDGTTDVKVCNLDIDFTALALYVESSGPRVDERISLRGNRVTNSRSMGFLGSGSDSELAFNLFQGNGGSNQLDHTAYLSAQTPVSGMRVVGNVMRGQYGPTCKGVVLVAHGAFDHLTVDGNTIDVDPAETSGGCYGIGVGSGGYPDATYVRHGVFSRNVIRNGGNAAFVLDTCTDCLVENNLVLNDWCYGNGTSCNWQIEGLVVPGAKARAKDDRSGNVVVRNNTVWFGPRAQGGGVGIRVGLEGTGYTVANNLVLYSAGAAVSGTTCFDYGLPLASYAYVDHNACAGVGGTPPWEAAHGSLASWRTYAGAAGFDAASLTSAPQLVAPGTDFTPGPSSPLLGAADPARAPATDVNGKARDAHPDVGAVER